MLKFYFETSIVWFIVHITYSIVFHKQFKKAQKKIQKETKSENEEKWGYIRTTLWYLLISFIPIIRLIVFIGKIVMIFDTDKAIETIKEKENKNGE